MSAKGKEAVKRPGTLCGVGVGPGDFELMTVKALRTLQGAAVIAAPDSGREESRALELISKGVNLSGKEILRLKLPMTREPRALKAARDEAAKLIAARLEKGLDVAFVTLGDPMLYSTFSYLAPLVKKRLPAATVATVPGVTSFTAAASATALPLAEGDEKVLILPGACPAAELKGYLAAFDTVVIMKAGRAIRELMAVIADEGLEARTSLVSELGWPGEAVLPSLNKKRAREMAGGEAGPAYLSMLIVRRRCGDA